MVQVHEMALNQWHSPRGVRALRRLWDGSRRKREAERIVGDLVAACERHDRIVDLGCGSGRMIAALPGFRRYYGFDISPDLLDVAKERFGGDRRCKFYLHDFLKGPRSRRMKPDVVLCVHVARHYDDPIALLGEVMRLWPARYYVFSVLCASEARDLLNGRCVAKADVDAFVAEAGGVCKRMVQSDVDGMEVHYLLVEASER